MAVDYQTIRITEEQAKEIAKANYGINAVATSLPGEIDFNFKLVTESKTFLLKVSRPEFDEQLLGFQQAILDHLNNLDTPCVSQTIINLSGNPTTYITDRNGGKRFVRLLSWLEGRLWSEVNPVTDELLWNLGEQAGRLTAALLDFNHPGAHRQLEWDIAQADWTKGHLDHFEKEEHCVLSYFLEQWETNKSEFEKLRRSIVHADVNDNNIIVSQELEHPKVDGIIDFGDAVFTQSINDLAVVVSYAIMGKPDLLRAASKVVAGYHKSFPLQEDELKLLYNLVAMRLVISVTKSVINRQKEPENAYLQISEQPAWDVLKRWSRVPPELAHFTFRKACGLSAHPNEDLFDNWTGGERISLREMFPQEEFQSVVHIDMSVSSTRLGPAHEFSDIDLSIYKHNQFRKENPHCLLAGGYLETRPFYSTGAYQKEGNSGTEYRTMHLGVDFWLKAGSPIQAPVDGSVFALHDNNQDKDYGPTLILRHQPLPDLEFFTLYGHLSTQTLSILEVGDYVKRGDLVGYIGNQAENGGWLPHLHFQVMLDLLGNKSNFPGVCYPSEVDVWKSICPNPNLLFDEPGLQPEENPEGFELIGFRKQHLGKSLSLSYQKPLHMVRGNGVHLIDQTGRKYLDTVNNVAHVGHEHPTVVKAGQQQMGLLNTNTRYLHENIAECAEKLLSTFPDELSVVHFVNSGSEANELAIRMAKQFTGSQEMIAIEMGYHGNTNACVDVSSYKFDRKGGQGVPDHTHLIPLPDSFRGIYRGENAGSKYLQHVEFAIEGLQEQGRKVAGFISESIMSCAGQIELPAGLLAEANQLVRNAGGLCIADEVQVGLGRVGSHFWGFQLHNVIPDIVTIGKPFGNGHPVAAVVCTRNVADGFANGMEYFNTFGGNPVSCAIGTAVLDVIRQEGLQQNALEVSNHLKAELKDLQTQFSIIGDVRGQGLFLGFELVDDALKPLTEEASYLVNRMRELGILMSSDGPDENVIKIKPPITFSRSDADVLIDRLRAVFREDVLKQYS